MKKLYTKVAGSDLKFSRFPFIKVLSLTSIAALLSSVSPVSAKNLDSKEEISTDIKTVAAASPQRFISVYNTFADYLGSPDVSKGNYVTVLNTALTPKVSASAGNSDYANFLTSTLSDVSDDSGVVNALTADGKNRSKRAVSTEEKKKQSIISPQLSVRNSISSPRLLQHDENTETIDVSRDDSTTIAKRDAELQRANTNVNLGEGSQVQKKSSVALGYMAHAMGESSTALGGEYNAKSEHGENDYTTASGNYSTALGSVSKATANGATAVGHRAYAKDKQSISVGFYSKANKERSVTLGDYAVTEVVGGVALGSASVADVAAGVEGYSPLGTKEENANFVWNSTQGAVSIGDISKSKTRQIGGVAAGAKDTDAVNIAQLKSLKTYVDKGWKLSVDGKNTKVVGIDDTVDFVAGSSNFEITKSDKDNKIKFDLAKNITLESVKITDGPQITATGINAGSKKITGVADGSAENDAVNFAQLKAMQAAAVVKGLKINTTGSMFKDAIADAQYSIAVGSEATALGEKSIAIGSLANSDKTNAISIGAEASAYKDKSIALGLKSQAMVDTGVAIGAYSVANVGMGAGYSPFLGHESEDPDSVWRSTLGAVSVGNISGMQSRQITGVAAGAQDADAVNVAQLKSLQAYVNKGWKLSVNGKNDKVVGIDNVVDFATGSDNLNITKGTDDNNIKFDLAKNITLDSLTAGTNTLDGTGLKITGGPQITATGINAGSKKITGVADGSADNDAVNFAQLKAMQAAAVIKGLKINTTGNDFKDAIADGESSVAIGSNASASKESSVALGAEAQATVNSGVAIGAYSVADIAADISGYSPLRKDASKNPDYVWKSKLGAVSVSNKAKMLSRQITGVAAGTQDTDAVNIAQLKELQTYVDKGWKLSVNGKNDKVVGIDNIVDFATGSDNLNITKGTDDNNIKFDLAKNITLASVKITDGPQITATGINAVGKKITGLTDGTDTTDAVNFGQLQKIEKQVAANSFVKQDTETKQITIGKDTDGDKIDILNKTGGARTLSGVKAGTEETDAVNFAQLQKVEQQVAASSFVKQDAETKRITIGKDVDGDKIDLFNKTGGARTLSGVKAGTEETDAVNFAQLQKVEQQVAASSFVKQDAETKRITIGKDTDGNKIDIANNNNEKRTLTGIKEGGISTDSSDAVTGSQLFKTDQNVKTLSDNFQATAMNIAKIFGGDTKYENGEWKIPTFKVKRAKADGTEEERNYTNVAEAFEGIGTTFTNINNEITNQINNAITNVKSESFVQQDKETNRLTIGAKTVGTEINIANSNNELRTISGVKDAMQAHEAVNKGQLDKDIENVNKDITNKFNDFTQNITNITQQVRGDALLWSKADQAFSAQHGEGETKTNSKITFLANGDITENSADAINGSQLYSMGNSFAAYLGGGAGYKDGKWEKLTLKVNTVKEDGTAGEVDYDTVEKAFSAVGTSFTNVQNKITNEITNQINNAITNVKSESFVQQDKETNRLTIGAKTVGTEINIANSNNELRTISGVKDAMQAHEAVNKGQLDKDIENVNKDITNKFNDFTQNITNITQQVRGDALLWSKADQAFSAQHGEGETKTNSKITFLANGDITENSADAINGSQLYSMGNGFAAYLGGGAGYKDGKWEKLTLKVNTVKEDGTAGEVDYDTVEKAFSAVGTSFTNVQNKITNEITNQINNAITNVKSESFVQQDKETNRLTIGAKTVGTEINIANKSGLNRVISGVADAKNNNDAVNKGQLDNSIKNVTDQLTNITQQFQGDSLLWSTSDQAFIAQHGEEKAKSKLKFLLNGDITADSTDAINGSQLYSMSNNLAAYFSDGAGYDKNGEWKAPIFKVNTVKEDGTESEVSYDTVEKAFSAVGASFTNVQNKITNEIAKEVNKTKGDALLWSESDNAFVAQHGKEKTNSKITFLANGDITKNSMDAINGSQLYSVINSLSRYFGGGAGYQNGEWKVPNFKVQKFSENGKSEEGTYHDVATAFEGVNGSLSNINERINNVAKDVSSNGLNWNETEQAYDASHNGTPSSKITHVANGDVSADSTDAVNGSQLFKTNDRVTKVEKRVDDIGQQVKDIKNTVTNDAVKYDKDDKGNKINKVTLAGVSESDPVLLDNVAAGDLSKDSTQAVNGGQLWETNQQMKVVLDDAKKYTDERFDNIINNKMSDVINEAKSYTDMKFDTLTYSIENVRKEARQAAAIGLATANLRYNETPGKLSVGFGSGLWRNQSAFAFGAGYTSESGSVLSNVSVTNSGGHWGIGAGFNMTLN